MKTLTILRDRDFVERARRVLAAEHERGNRTVTLRRLAALTVYGPAGSFHVGFARAYSQVSAFRRMPPQRRRAWASTPCRCRVRDMAARVDSLLEPGRRPSVARALTAVMSQGAPRFYFSVRYGMRILRKHLRQ